MLSDSFSPAGPDSMSPVSIAPESMGPVSMGPASISPRPPHAVSEPEAERQLDAEVSEPAALAKQGALHAGDWVEVLSKDEILATLDKRGQLDGLPFMPQMFEFCGQRYKVFKTAHKTCDTATMTGGRRMHEAVHLEGLRCNGAAHGGCGAACLLFWKEAWLRPSAPPSEAPAPTARSERTSYVQGLADRPRHLCTEPDVWDGTRTEESTDADPTYVCQATQLPAATTLLPWWDLRQYVEDYTSGNVPLKALAKGALYVGSTKIMKWSRRFQAREALVKAYDRFQSWRGGVPFPRKVGTVPEKSRTPHGSLNLQPGELVRVKTYEQVLATLDSNNKNRGLYFDAEEVPYCGSIFRVRSRVDRIIDEATGKLIQVKSAVILDGAWCRAHYSDKRMFCPRAVFPFWREIWLERVNPDQLPADAHLPAVEPVFALTERRETRPVVSLPVLRDAG